MIDAWLNLPLPLMFGAIAGVYGATAIFLYWLCFGRQTRRWMLTFNGAVAELFGAIMVIFGILIGFVAGDVWDSWRQAVSAVESEGASLSMLSELASASGLPTDGIRRDIRVYVAAVAEKEWPSMADNGTAAPEARQALGALIKTVASMQHDPKRSQRQIRWPAARYGAEGSERAGRPTCAQRPQFGKHQMGVCFRSCADGPDQHRHVAS